MNNWETITTEKRKAMEARIAGLLSDLVEQELQIDALQQKVHLCTAYDKMEARIEQLETRLELYATDSDGNKIRVPDECDGIYCRNATIHLLDKNVDRLRNRAEQLEQSLQKAYEELETLKENDDEN